jgi:hypothetical protein
MSVACTDKNSLQGRIGKAKFQREKHGETERVQPALSVG